MPASDLVIQGTVLTVADLQPAAEALAVSDGRIIAVGKPSPPGCGSRCTTTPPVTPAEPLRNISVAATRIAPSGRVLGPEQRLTVEQAIRAQTIDAAWQLFSDDVVGSLEVGKYADMVVLSPDPRRATG
jgi:predicted amidohydrolase YtcJ